MQLQASRHPPFASTQLNSDSDTHGLLSSSWKRLEHHLITSEKQKRSPFYLLDRKRRSPLITTRSLHMEQPDRGIPLDGIVNCFKVEQPILL